MIISKKKTIKKEILFGLMIMRQNNYESVILVTDLIRYLFIMKVDQYHYLRRIFHDDTIGQHPFSKQKS
jgi:hypothetical protein